jgi:hypothetical protein
MGCEYFGRFLESGHKQPQRRENGDDHRPKQYQDEYGIQNAETQLLVIGEIEDAVSLGPKSLVKHIFSELFKQCFHANLLLLRGRLMMK